MKIAETYWTVPPAGGPPIGERELHETLAESVKLHLASDVPLGVFLSGGIDSSAVANLAQKASEQPVNTFTLAFEEQEYSEAPHARAVAEAIGTTHHEIVLSESTFVDSLEAAFNSLDQPSFDGLNSYYISKAVREAGLTVALVGTGGDELFGGYSSFRYVPKMHRMAQRTAWMPKAAMVGAANVVAGREESQVRARSPPKRGGPSSRKWSAAETISCGCTSCPMRCSFPISRPSCSTESPRRTAHKSGLPPVLHDRLMKEAARPVSAGGDQRDGAAAVPGRASAARRRCGQHGRLAGNPAPAGRSGARWNR